MKTALLIIDMQQALLNNDPAPFELNIVIDNINKLIEQAGRHHVPTFFVQHEAAGFLEPESSAWALHPALKRNSDCRFIRKSISEPFSGTTLQQTLDQQGIDNLIICGFASEFCVDSTVRRASVLGYTVQLVIDGHTTTDKPHLTASQIRHHHNSTLSWSPSISAVGHDEVTFID